MKQSMVDYVLERGNKDYGEFYRRSEQVEPSLKMNQRKLLEYLFNPNKQMRSLNRQDPSIPSISELKYAEIVTQFNYISEKLHTDLNKKNVVLDSQIYKLEHQWTIKKIPEFYCYYFLKFVYANKPARLQEIVFDEFSNMSRENDGYTIMRKAIEARQACLTNLKREAIDLNSSQIVKDLMTIQHQLAAQVKLKLTQDARSQNYKTGSEDLPSQKDWKNKLELLFDSLSHLRKLTLYVVEMITKWKNSVYTLTEDPKRFRERIIFYHNGVNYLLKTLNDTRFFKDMALSEFLSFSDCYDPFVLRPLVVLESTSQRSVDESILYSLTKPKQAQMRKIINCLELLAEEEYDEDSHSRFLGEKKNTGELKFRKDNAVKLGEDTPPKKSSKGLPYQTQRDQNPQANKVAVETQRKSVDRKSISALSKTQSRNAESVKAIVQTVQRKSLHSKKLAEHAEQQKAFGTQKIRVKAMSSVDLKKVSPYLARNQKIVLAHKVIELQQEYKQAKALYAASTRKDMDETLTVHKPKESKQVQTEIPRVEELKGYADTRVFNKYVEENLKQLEQADNKKKYLYKNRIAPNYEGPKVNYKKLTFHQRKEFQYNQNLKEFVNPLDDKKQSAKVIHNPTYKTPGTKAVIQISNQGIRRKNKQVLFTKTVGEAIQKASAQDFQKKAMKRLYPEQVPPENQQSSGLYQMGRKPQIIVLRQQPEKLEEIKNFLYAKIKAQLTEQITRQNQDRDNNIKDLIEQERRKRASDLIQMHKQEELRGVQDEERRRKEKLEMERNKINNDMSIEPIQVSEEILEEFLSSNVLNIQSIVFNTLFGSDLQSLLPALTDSLYTILFKISILDLEVGYAIVSFDDRDLFRRRWSIKYLAVSEPAYSVSSFHFILNYLWKNDPVEEIDVILIDNTENAEGGKVINDVQEYADRNGLSFSKQLYSNSTENKYVFVRNTELYPEGVFKDRNNLYSKSLVMKTELLSANIALNEGTPSRIDLNLQQNTHYIFLLEELFRNYMTPEEVVELRQNTQNIRRLKDIFKIVLELEKNKPKVAEFKVLEGLNMDDLNDKIRQHTVKPYQKYYWKEHYDMDKANRLLLAILEERVELICPINSVIFNDNSFMRLRLRQKVLTLKSSISPKDIIYILPTKNQKIKLFFLNAVIFKQMRIQLFMFLNLLFNNIVKDERQYIENLWLPQFKVNNEDEHSHRYCQKQITRVTDFSITMKKNIWLTEELYFCNKQYIKSAVSYIPRQTDVLFMQPYIIGVLHSDIEKESPGVPLYSKLIDKGLFYKQ